MMDNFEYIQKYHCLLNAQKVVLAYGGEIKNGVVSNVLSIIDNSMEQEANTSLKKRVLQVVVECIQNIERHADEFIDPGHKASFLVFKKGEDYLVSFCNSIHNKNKEALKEKIDKINSLSKEELSQFYKTALRNNTISNKGGAGLGLIEISRKSGNKINYLFEPIDSNFSSFSLMAKIS